MGAELMQPSTVVGTGGFLAHWDREFHRLQTPIVRYGLAVVSVMAAVGFCLPLQYYQLRDGAWHVLGGDQPAAAASSVKHVS
jgi:hypothetical protein